MSANIAREIATLFSRNRNFRFLVLGYTIYSLAGQMVFPLLPLYTGSIGLDLTHTATILSAVGIGAIFSAPISGFLSDRYGRRTVILMGWGFLSIALAWLQFARGVAEISVSALIWGVATGMSGSSVAPLLTESSDSTKLGSAFGYFLGISGVVSGAGPVIAGQMARLTSSFFLPFAIAAILAPLSIAFALMLEEQPKKRDPSAEITATAQTNATEGRHYARKPLALMALWIVFFLINALGNQIFIPLFPRYLEFKIGANAADVGLVFTTLSILNALIFILGGKLADRYSKIRLIVASQIIGLPPILLLVSASTLQQVIAIIAVIVVLGNIGYPAVQSSFMGSLPASSRGKAQGLVGMTNPISQTVGPLTAAGLWSLWGPDSIIYVSTVLFAIAVIPILLLVPRRNRNAD